MRQMGRTPGQPSQQALHEIDPSLTKDLKTAQRTKFGFYGQGGGGWGEEETFTVYSKFISRNDQETLISCLSIVTCL